MKLKILYISFTFVQTCEGASCESEQEGLQQAL